MQLKFRFTKIKSLDIGLWEEEFIQQTFDRSTDPINIIRWLLNRGQSCFLHSKVSAYTPVHLRRSGVDGCQEELVSGYP